VAKDSAGNIQSSVQSVNLTTLAADAPVAPTASAVSISGTAQVGQLLTGSYTYADANGDPEGTSTFRWLRDGVAIGGATAITYTLVNADQGHVITFEVTPVSTVAPTTGTPVLSSATATVLPTGYVTQGGLTWSPNNASSGNWGSANTYCAGTINGQTGWRLPTQAELVALYGSGALTGSGWTLNSTWSSTVSPLGHYAVNVSNGNSLNSNDNANRPVTCVHD
jgi:hypothetical protein